MKKKHKKNIVIAAILVLTIVLLILFVLIPYQRKIKAPTRENSDVERTSESGKINSNAITNQTEEQKSPTSTNITPLNQADTYANPDSSTSISNPETSDYSNVQGSQFDERN